MAKRVVLNTGSAKSTLEKIQEEQAKHASIPRVTLDVDKDDVEDPPVVELPSPESPPPANHPLRSVNLNRTASPPDVPVSLSKNAGKELPMPQKSKPFNWNFWIPIGLNVSMLLILIILLSGWSEMSNRNTQNEARLNSIQGQMDALSKTLIEKEQVINDLENTLGVVQEQNENLNLQVLEAQNLLFSMDAELEAKNRLVNLLQKDLDLQSKEFGQTLHLNDSLLSRTLQLQASVNAFKNAQDLWNDKEVYYVKRIDSLQQRVP